MHRVPGSQGCRVLGVAWADKATRKRVGEEKGRGVAVRWTSGGTVRARKRDGERERDRGRCASSSALPPSVCRALGRCGGQLGCAGLFVQRWVRARGRRGGSGSGGLELSLNRRAKLHGPSVHGVQNYLGEERVRDVQCDTTTSLIVLRAEGASTRLRVLLSLRSSQSYLVRR